MLLDRVADNLWTMAIPEENELPEPANEEFPELPETKGLDEDLTPEGHYVDGPQDPEAPQ